MKNRTITTITVLFASMLIGIIAIQAWWIHRALQLNTQQFDAATYRSLESVVKQTEQKENFTFIQNAIGFDSILNTKKHHLHTKLYQPVPSMNSVVIGITNNLSVMSHNLSVAGHNLSVISHNGRTEVKVETHRGNTKTISKCYFFYGNPDSEYVYVNGPLKVMDEAPTLQLSEKLEKIENIDTLVEKMIHIRNPDSISVEPNYIQRLIRGELWQNDLPDTFYFALLKPNGKYLYASPGFHDTGKCYKISLYPNDLFGRNILLFVDIPGKLARIHSDIWWAFILSLVFTMSLLILFLFSIQMLIRHKNLLEAKNDFINHMSHEIKTPLAGISLGADMLIKKNDKMTLHQISKVAQSIKEQSSRLHKDISAVLSNSLVDEVPATKFAPFNIVDSIHSSVNEFRLVLEEEEADIEVHFPKERILKNGNEMLWQKVFCNLLDNSIKFTNNTLRLLIQGTFSASNILLIQFSDNGIGVSKEDLPHVFEKFYRSDYYRQSHIQGFGLGLSFVKKVVEMHHGTIKAESEVGKGTTISIELPLYND